MLTRSKSELSGLFDVRPGVVVDAAVDPTLVTARIPLQMGIGSHAIQAMNNALQSW